MNETAKKLIITAAQAAKSLHDAEAARLEGIIQGYTLAALTARGDKQPAAKPAAKPVNEKAG